MKRLCSKLKDRHGVTLTEMLATLLIMLLVTSIAATGIPAAKAAYDRAVDAANAQVLLSMTVTELRKELGLASGVPDGYAGTELTYTSGTNGGQSRILVMEDEDSLERIYIQEMRELKKDDDSAVMDPRPLVSIGSDDKTKKLHVVFGQEGGDAPVSYSDGVFTIRNLQVMKDAQVLAKLDELTIRTINK